MAKHQMGGTGKPVKPQSAMKRAGAQAARGGRESAEGLGYLLSLALPWLIEQYAPMPIPPEITNTLTALAMSVLVRVKEHLI